jgi:arylsulfatase A-like enzyme
VAVTADHGEQFLEHHALGHGGQLLYNEVLHIPFILSMPDGGAARTIAAPVGTIDVAPTLLAAAGIEPPAAFQGRSALDAGPEERDVVVEDWRTLKLITSRWSYLHGTDGKRRELYDLTADPGERLNLAGARAATAAELQTRLLATLKTRLNHDYVVSRPIAKSRLSEAVRDRLRKLGYLD